MNNKEEECDKLLVELSSIVKLVNTLLGFLLFII